MATKDFVWGAYDKRLELEIQRLLGYCKKMGFRVSRREITALIGERSRTCYMEKHAIENYLKNIKMVGK